MFISLGSKVFVLKKSFTAMGDMVNHHGAMVFAILCSMRPTSGTMRVDAHELKAGFA